MPIYEYRCPRCGAETERLQYLDGPVPSCEGVAGSSGQHEPVRMKKKVSVGSFVLKGKGWARDGYT